MTMPQNWAEPAALAHTDSLVLDYLGTLWAETEDLAPELRDDLMSTVADYIARRRVAGDDNPEVILRRLGPPESIAAAVRRGRMPPHLRLPAPRRPAPDTGRPAAGAEFAAIALLTGGAIVLPGIAPLGGLLLVSGSPVWSPLQKTVAWLVAGVPALLSVLLAVAAVLFGEPEVLAVALVVLIAGPFVAGLSLVPGLSRRGEPG